MRVGLTYDLKEAVRPGEGLPDDYLEEYDSADTIDAIEAAVTAGGHLVTRLGGGREFLAKVLREPVDLVFNIAEGLGNYRSREAQVPSVLEMLDIPYSGSDPLCLAVCLDKPLTKQLLLAAGVTTPRWLALAKPEDLDSAAWDDFPLPAFIKPAHEGSSKGIRSGARVETLEDLRRRVQELLELYRQPVMVEEYIAGEEVTVGVLGNSPPRLLNIMRVVPRKKDPNFFYSLEVKRRWRELVDYECPAALAPSTLERITDLALTAFRTLRCRDVSRVDFRVNAAGVPYVLEINPLPGLNPGTGDLCIMARLSGLSYPELVSTILEAAIRRRQCTSA